MLSQEVRDLVQARAATPALRKAMLTYLGNLESLRGIEHHVRFDKGKGPTGVFTLLDGAAFAWLFPSHEPLPVVQVHAPRPEEVAARHPGAFAGAKTTPRSRKNIVHVELSDAGDLAIAEALARDVYNALPHPVVGASRGAAGQRLSRAGEYFVAAELNRRGAYAVTFAGNMPNIDIMASDEQQRRTVMIQVKTRRKGTWQCSMARAVPRTKKDADEKFWVFVDLPDSAAHPTFYLAPEWWVLNDIYVHHQAYLDRHDGKRARNDTSTHHAIQPVRIQEWRDRWDVLGIF